MVHIPLAAWMVCKTCTDNQAHVGSSFSGVEPGEICPVLALHLSLTLYYRCTKSRRLSSQYLHHSYTRVQGFQNDCQLSGLTLSSCAGMRQRGTGHETALLALSRVQTCALGSTTAGSGCCVTYQTDHFFCSSP